MFDDWSCEKMYTYRIVENFEEKELIYNLRYAIYCEEKKWLHSSNYLKCVEKDKYDESSLHFGAFDINNILVGSVRLILPKNEMAMPIEKFFKFYPDFSQRKVEISRLVIPKDRRGLNILGGLLCEIYHWGITNDITHAYAIVENNLLNYINRKGYPFKAIGDGQDYFGGYTIPICLILSDVKDHVLKIK